MSERIAVLDAESFYDPKGKYSLRTKGMSTSLYIRDKRFKEHCWSIWLPEEEEFPQVYWYDDIPKALKRLPWKQMTLLGHHTHFDGFILSHHHGLVPKRYACTLSMARGWFGAHTPADLGTLASYCGYQNKLVDIGKLMAGVSYFPPGIKRTLAGDYCKADVMNTWLVYQYMLKQGFPPLELDQIDRTVAMFANPVLRVNRKLAQAELEREQKRKSDLLEDVEASVEELQSADLFADFLRSKGVEPPTKLSKSTGKEAYAFAKTDLAFQKLLAHEDPEVVDLVEARLAVKSTIGESRARAFLDRSYRTVRVQEDASRVGSGGAAPLPIYINYAKAHTLRRTGGDNNNPQNWTAARGKNKHVKLRHCVEPPPGHVIVVVDSAQIECRVNAMLHQDFALVQAFREKRDIYSEFATDFYGYPVKKCPEQETERFVGKTCTLGLGFGLGAPRLRYSLAVGTTGPAVFISQGEAKLAVDLWRAQRAPIVAGWRKFDNLLAVIRSGRGGPVEYGPLVFDKGCVHMPNGLRLHYPELELHEDGYRYRNGRKYSRIWGGVMTENTVQSLACIIVHDQLATVNYRLVGESHDEAWFVVPRKQADACLEAALKALKTPPSWWKDLPLSAEGSWGKSYGEVK